jgi:hypothetical protein
MPDGRGKFSIEEIKEGLERFKKENGHYPIAPEIDSCIYLPSSRAMQRNFGGLVKLRKLLGYEDINFGVGKYRSEISSRVGEIGFKKERELEKILIEHFGEPFIHIEKPLDIFGKQRFDFFVYARNIRFGVDIFYSRTYRDIQKNINAKINGYKNYTKNTIYFVLANEEINQKEINQLIVGKKKDIPLNIKVISLKNFLDMIKQLKTLFAK